MRTEGGSLLSWLAPKGATRVRIPPSPFPKSCPYDCPKTDRILGELYPYLLRRQNGDGTFHEAGGYGLAGTLRPEALYSSSFAFSSLTISGCLK
jgi:hypothetical protein